jgi:hypothetical protein
MDDAVSDGCYRRKLLASLEPVDQETSGGIVERDLHSALV